MLHLPRPGLGLLGRLDGVPDDVVGVAGILRIEIAGQLAAGFRQRRRTGDDAGAPERQAFGHRQAPAFVHRREQGEAAAGIEPFQLVVGGILDQQDLAVEEVGVAELLHQVADQPADPAGEHQRRDPVARHLLEQTAPDPEQQDVVLARLDGRHDQGVTAWRGQPVRLGIARPDRRRGGFRRRGEAGADRDRVRRVAELVAAGLRLPHDVVGARTRDRQENVDQRKHIPGPFAKALHQVVVAPFGPAQRDEVVDQQGEAEVALTLRLFHHFGIVGMEPGRAEHQQHIAGFAVGIERGGAGDRHGDLDRRLGLGRIDRGWRRFVHIAGSGGRRGPIFQARGGRVPIRRPETANGRLDARPGGPAQCAAEVDQSTPGLPFGPVEGDDRSAKSGRHAIGDTPQRRSRKWLGRLPGLFLERLGQLDPCFHLGLLVAGQSVVQRLKLGIGDRVEGFLRTCMSYETHPMARLRQGGQRPAELVLDPLDPARTWIEGGVLEQVLDIDPDLVRQGSFLRPRPVLRWTSGTWQYPCRSHDASSGADGSFEQ